MTVKQGGNPHGTTGSSLKTFASACGVTDLSQNNITVVASGEEGRWHRVAPTSAGSPRDVNVARAWRDAKGNFRVVDVSRSGANGKVLQMSRMCYSAKGSLRKVSEHYVDIPSCACGRHTEIAYDEQGQQTKRTQEWYAVPSHESQNAPANAASMPAAIEYKSFDTLPFANLLKGKNASTH